MPILHHLTDTHFPLEEGRLVTYVESLATASPDERPALIVHSGDLVDGGTDEAELRGQLRGARDLLDRAGVPWHCLCHTHDHLGESVESMGRAFQEILGQPFLQHLSQPDLEIYLLSGALTAGPEFHPPKHVGDLPPWGYDLYDAHVRDLLENFVNQNPGVAPRRVLFTHHPIVPFLDLTETGHPDARFIRGYHVIHADHRPAIFALLHRLGITHVFGGHCHLATCNRVEGIEFRTAPSFQRTRTGIDGVFIVGYGVLSWTAESLDYRVQTVA